MVECREWSEGNSAIINSKPETVKTKILPSRKYWVLGCICYAGWLNGWLFSSRSRIVAIKAKLVNKSGPGSSVGIASGCGLDGPVIESPWERDYPHLSRLTLGSTQPPVQWSFPGVKSGRGVTQTSHPLLVRWSRKNRTIPLLPLWVVRLCTETQCLYKGALYLNFL